MSRTVLSLKNLLFGLFPNVSNKALAPHIITEKDHRKEVIVPNQWSCPRISEIYGNVAQGALYQLLQQQRTRFNLPENAHSWVVTMDQIKCRKAHGLPLPPMFTPELISFANQASLVQFVNVATGLDAEPHPDPQVMTQLAHSSEDSREILRLGTGPLFQELLDGMQRAVRGEEQARLMVFSGHDTTIIPALAALRVFNWQWPPFASCIILELYEDEKTKAFFVRVEHDGREVLFTPHSAFTEDVQARLLPPSDRLESCKHHGGSTPKLHRW